MHKHYYYDGTGTKLLNHVNVMAFGAAGDGVTDDSAAIQATLDYLKDSGGTVFFPAGTYLLKNHVMFYSNQHLFFEKGAVLKQGAAINALMIGAGHTGITGYEGTHDVVIDGAVFDGGTYTTNNTLLAFCHSQNMVIKNCTFKNAYGKWHNLEINSSRYVTVENCNFEGSRKTNENGCLLQIDSFYSTGCYPWGTGAVDNTVSQHVDIRNCLFYDCTAAPFIGNHSNGGGNIRIHGNRFIGNTGARGAINFNSGEANINIDICNNTFVGCTSGITIPTNPGLSTVHDNRFTDVTTPIVTGGITAYNNMVDGTFTA